MTPAVQSALAQRYVTVAGLIEIVLPTATIRLCDGAGVVTWGALTFNGIDETFGAIGSIGAISDGTGDNAPAVELVMLPPSVSAAAAVSRADFQGSPVNMWLAVIDVATGEAIPDPELLFTGEMDTTTLTVDRGSRELAMQIVSSFERFFDNDEGERLSDAYHKNNWPGETGLANVTGITKRVYWGGQSPRSTVSYGGGGYYRAGGSLDDRAANRVQ